MTRETKGYNPPSRLNLRLPVDLREKVDYWAAKKNMSANEFIVECIYSYIARANGDHDLANLEQGRLAQLIDGQISLASSVRSLENVVNNMSLTMANLTHGDTQLLDEEDDDGNDELGIGIQ